MQARNWGCNEIATELAKLRGRENPSYDARNNFRLGNPETVSPPPGVAWRIIQDPGRCLSDTIYGVLAGEVGKMFAQSFSLAFKVLLKASHWGWVCLLIGPTKASAIAAVQFLSPISRLVTNCSYSISIPHDTGHAYWQGLRDTGQGPTRVASRNASNLSCNTQNGGSE